MQKTDVEGGPVDHERCEALQQAASSLLVPLRVKPLPEGCEFRARVEAGRIGALTMARIRSTPHHVARSADSITSTDSDLLKVVLHRRGRMQVAQDGREPRVEPGQLLVCDTSRPYQLRVPDTCDVVAIGLPRSLLGSSADLVSRRTATPLSADTGLQSVIAAFVSGLGDQMDALPGHAGLRLADALVSLLITAFTETSPERIETATGFIDRIKAFVLANLNDPGLSVASVASHHGISTRHLHRLFHDHELTFAAWIREERLHRIQRDLADPRLSHRTVASIAARWGLPDASHLSRRLKKAFDRTATELRRTHPVTQDPDNSAA